jgi:alkylated DNA repair protein (DNA oxidative demethylase)
MVGRDSRFAYHGGPRSYPGTADPGRGFDLGRINMALAVTGFS